MVLIGFHVLLFFSHFSYIKQLKNFLIFSPLYFYPYFLLLIFTLSILFVKPNKLMLAFFFKNWISLGKKLKINSFNSLKHIDPFKELTYLNTSFSIVQAIEPLITYLKDNIIYQSHHTILIF